MCREVTHPSLSCIDLRLPEPVVIPSKNTVVVMSHVAKKSNSDSGGSLPMKDGAAGDHARPLPILEGQHSLAHDMKFGYAFEGLF